MTKRFLCRNTAFIFIVILVVRLVGVALARLDIYQRAHSAYYSHPFESQFELSDKHITSTSAPNLFDVFAHCVAVGGRGESRWYVSARLFDTSSGKPYQIWESMGNSVRDVSLLMSGVVTVTPGGPVQRTIPRPASETTFHWRFNRYNFIGGECRHLKFVVEGVAVPIATADDRLGTDSIGVNEVESAKIATARQEPGASYFRKAVKIDASNAGIYRVSEIPNS